MSLKKVSKNQPEIFKFSEKNLEIAKKIISNYPEGKQQSAVMAFLYIAQNLNYHKVYKMFCLYFVINNYLRR